MHKRSENKNFADCKAVSTKELASLLNVGINSARKFGDEAGAKVKIGRRTVWNLSKIQNHLDMMSN